MRKLVLSAGAALILLGSVGSADAQYRYRHGYYRGGWGGGAVAAGVVGGLVLGGLAAAAARPAYAYPYGYGYAPPPAPPYYGGYYQSAPVYGPTYGYPAYGGGVVYSADPYAAYHEVRGGYRTVYRRGYGRVIIGGPAY
jgi:hypothetical protein